mmetsp:Transcript_13240/g.35468  ORF Transcript_13240/g.35468 Transcript_13240/m.35468 type:complete len:203 (-) Transcript_13240:18-626(-)
MVSQEDVQAGARCASHRQALLQMALQLVGTRQRLNAHGLHPRAATGASIWWTCTLASPYLVEIGTVTLIVGAPLAAQARQHGAPPLTPADGARLLHRPKCLRARFPDTEGPSPLNRWLKRAPTRAFPRRGSSIEAVAGRAAEIHYADGAKQAQQPPRVCVHACRCGVGSTEPAPIYLPVYPHKLNSHGPPTDSQGASERYLR